MATDYSTLSDAEIRGRVRTLQTAGRRARPATPPPRADEDLPCVLRVPRPSPIPFELAERAAVEGVETVAPPRFPRAEAMIETITLADRCRFVAAALDAVAASEYEPATLRRRAHGLVRSLVAELGLRVALVCALALLLVVGCAGAVDHPDPTPDPLDCVAVDFSGVCSSTGGCHRDYICNRAPQEKELGSDVVCKATAESSRYTCSWGAL